MNEKEWASRKVHQAVVMNNAQCAVLVPIVTINGSQALLFEVRSNNLSWQPGDICFPGGGIEKTDQSPVAAAVREMEEELGVSPSDIRILGPLDYVESPVGVTVWPVAAVVVAEKFSPSLDEVTEVFTVPIDWFRREIPQTVTMEIATRPMANFPKDINLRSHQWQARRTYNVYVYRYGKRIIWGITAHIVKKFIEEYEKFEG